MNRKFSDNIKQTKQSSSMSIRKLVYLSLMLAISVVLGLFTGVKISDSLQISFSHLATAVTGFLFGPIAAVVGALTDFLCWLIKPTGAFNPAFTFSAGLTGLAYGFVLFPQRSDIWRIIFATIITTVIINVGLNTLWLQLYYGTNYWAVFPARLIKNLAQAVADVALLTPVLKLLKNKNIVSKINGI